MRFSRQKCQIVVRDQLFEDYNDGGIYSKYALKVNVGHSKSWRSLKTWEHIITNKLRNAQTGFKNKEQRTKNKEQTTNNTCRHIFIHTHMPHHWTTLHQLFSAITSVIPWPTIIDYFDFYFDYLGFFFFYSRDFLSSFPQRVWYICGYIHDNERILTFFNVLVSSPYSPTAILLAEASFVTSPTASFLSDHLVACWAAHARPKRRTQREMFEF